MPVPTLTPAVMTVAAPDVTPAPVPGLLPTPGPAPRPVPTPGRPCARTPARRDRGQVAIEYLGFLPLLLLVGMLAVQLGLAAYAANQAGTAARVAARSAGQDFPRGDPAQDGRDAISDWLTDGDEFDINLSGGEREVTATVRIKVPSVVPGIDWSWAERSATFPRG
ncbi:TadE/TadG family type IV pilus assembly protein [Streptomyces sp. AM 2-1-1]|uniref:TadE/TadG family type IV pilus assembly protein n=1 Tax=Streptomyces sp. AM 2-1-1 TaxID=3028709 RepID=UPI0031BA7C0B